MIENLQSAPPDATQASLRRPGPNGTDTFRYRIGNQYFNAPAMEASLASDNLKAARDARDNEETGKVYERELLIQSARNDLKVKAGLARMAWRIIDNKEKSNGTHQA